MSPTHPVRLTILLPFAAGLTALFSVRSSLAQLRFDAPPTCGNGASFERAMRERLGDQAPQLLDQTRVQIAPNGDAFSLSMQVGQESRTLDDVNCADLYNAAIVVAIALWRAPHENPPNREPSPVTAATIPKTGGEVPPQRAPKTPPFVVSSPNPPEPNHQRLLVAAQFGIASGLLPKVGPLVGIRGAYEFGAVGLAVTARYFPTTSQRDANEHGVSVDGIGVRAGAYLKPIDTWGFEAGFGMSRLHGAGLGSVANTDASVVSLGPYLGLWVLPFEYRGLFAQLGAEAEFSVLTPRFVIDGYNEVFRTGRINLQGSLGAGYRFR